MALLAEFENFVLNPILASYTFVALHAKASGTDVVGRATW